MVCLIYCDTEIGVHAPSMLRRKEYTRTALIILILFVVIIASAEQLMKMTKRCVVIMGVTSFFVEGGGQRFMTSLDMQYIYYIKFKCFVMLYIYIYNVLNQDQGRTKCHQTLSKEKTKK